MALKFPTLDQLSKSVFETILRFPLPIFSALVGTYYALLINESDLGYLEELNYIRMLMTAALGLSLSLAIALYIERKEANRFIRIGLNLFGLSLLSIYYYQLGENVDESEALQFFVLNIACHLLVSFSPFLVKNETNGFWQFNERLFTRFLTASLYTAVLWIGLAGALAAIDNLFGVNINGRSYFRMWIVLVGLFNTIFFLAGVPSDFKSLNESNAYPKGLKLFTQFVLLPLVVVYLLILYAYFGKIILLWTLPQGWVSWLVNGFSVAGILALLLIYPIRNNEENKWVNTFTRWFFIALLPLIVLLFISIGFRVSQYGITENRYYIFAVAIWLLIMAVNFVLKGFNHIKIVPISLSLFMIVSVIGPFNATNTGVRSQLSRIDKIFKEQNLLVNGKIKPLAEKDTFNIEAASNIRSILDYLDDHKALLKLQPYFTFELDTFLMDYETDYRRLEQGESLKVSYERLRWSNGESKILKYIGLKDFDDYTVDAEYRNENYEYYSIRTDENEAINLMDYSSMLPVNLYSGSYFTDTTDLKQNSQAIQLIFNENKDSLLIFENKTKATALPLIQLLKNKPNEEKEKLENLRLEFSSSNLQYSLQITELEGDKENNKKQVNRLQGYLFWKKKE
jgi:hypothetical protein